MATTTERLALLITADGKGAIRELDSIGKSAKKNLGDVESSGAKISTSMIKAGAGAAVGGVTILAALKGVADGAQDTADSVDLATATFGNLTATGVDQWATGAARALGLSREAALDLASAYGTILKGVGETGAALTRESQGLASATVDLAERFKLDPKDVESKITNALSVIKGGDTIKGAKALLPLGIKITPKDIDAKAVELGIAKAGEKLSREKLTITAAAIIASNDAKGEFAKSVAGGDIKAQAAVARAEWKNASDDIGAAVLPVFSKIATVAADIAGAIKDLHLTGPVAEVVAYGAAFTAVVGAVTAVGGALGKVGSLASKVLDIGATKAAATANAELAVSQGAVAESAGAMAVAEGTGTAAIVAEGTAAEATAVSNGILATSISGVATAIGVAAAAWGIYKLAVDGAKASEDQADHSLINQSLGKDLLSSFDPQGKKVGGIDPTSRRKGEELALIANLLGRDAAPTNRYEQYIDFDKDARAAHISEEAFKKLKDALNQLRPDQARQVLAEIRDGLGGFQVPPEVNQQLSQLDTQVYNSEAAAKALTPAVDGMGDSASDAADKVSTLADALAGVEDKTSTLTFAQKVNQFLDPVQKWSDAIQAVQDAQKRLADAAQDDTDRIANAYQNVADARRRLVEAEHPDDGSFGLKHTTAAQEIADAEKRLATANARLSSNPNDAKGNTDRDLALSDLEAAKRRRQDEIRNAKQQADKVASARRDLDSAEKDLAKQLRDPNKAVASAARDLERAERDRIQAEIEFGELAAVAKDGLKGVKDDIQKLADEGLIPASLASTLIARIDAMGQAAIDFVKKVEGINAPGGGIDGTGKPGGPGPKPTAPYPNAPDRNDPSEVQPKDRDLNPAPGEIDGTNHKLLRSLGLWPAGVGADDGMVLSANNGQLYKFHAYVGTEGVWDPVTEKKPKVPNWNRKFAMGGRVPGIGDGDTVPAMLTPGEYVITKSAVSALGVETLDRLNRGVKPQHFATGGQVGVRASAFAPSMRSQSSTRDTDDRPSVTFAPTIIQHVPEPELAGAAVVTALRGVASRSGRGIRVI